jgi:hypothetical protein
MSTTVVNHVPGMWQNAGICVNSFGKDQSNSISYNFNAQGFRGPNFDYQPNHAFFGCSLVFGIGVAQQDTFVYLFEKSQNYGLAGAYSNDDIRLVLEKFLCSDLYKPTVKIAVVWRDPPDQVLKEFYNQIQDLKILHFFCNQPLDGPLCFAMPKNLDYDISGTHPGPITHRYLCKILQNLFRP